jgi:UDP-glucose 4-epimerase
VLAAADQRLRHNRQGFIGWFIRLAIEDREIQVFGDGSQLRDFVYVDDAADAFLRAGATAACDGEVFNVGGDEAVSHRDLVSLLLRTAGTGSVRYVEWPADKKRIDIGSFYSDSTRFRDTVGWRPRVGLREGLARTLAFYREHIKHYIDEPHAVSEVLR